LVIFGLELEKHRFKKGKNLIGRKPPKGKNLFLKEGIYLG